MQQPAQDTSPNVDMSLRDHLIAAQAGTQQPAEPSSSPSHDPSLHSAPPTGSPDQNIDPAIGGQPYPMSAGESVGDENAGDSKKGRRELSTSKRAAQNRAAQRAFRQRKEEYIKKLKSELENNQGFKDRYQASQQENYQLRAYIISLQSRLLELQGEYPQPPSDMNLPHPSSIEPMPHSGPPATAPMIPTAVSQLQAAAAQAAAAQASELNNSNRSHRIAEGTYVPAQDFQPGGHKNENADMQPVARMGNSTSTA